MAKAIQRTSEVVSVEQIYVTADGLRTQVAVAGRASPSYRPRLNLASPCVGDIQLWTQR